MKNHNIKLNGFDEMAAEKHETAPRTIYKTI